MPTNKGKIQIKKIEKEDLAFLNETRNLVSEEFLHDSRKFTYKETLNWFDRSKPDYRIIWIENVRIGYFRVSNYSKINKNLYIGADIHPEFQGKGYSKESYKIFIPQIFEEYDLHKISLEVLSTNKRAINLYLKLGFRREGIKRDEVFKGNKYVDSIIMSVLKNEWK